MAIRSRFKQQCPSCEAIVAFDASTIGKKVACPKCKYKFVVEDPRERDRVSVARSKDSKAKNGVTAKKPAPRNGRRAAAEEAPRRSRKNGSAAVSAKGKTAPRRARGEEDDLDDDYDDEDFDDAPKKKSKKGGPNKLVIGLGLAVVGLAVLGLAAYFLIFKKSDEPVAQNNNNGDPGLVQPGQNPGMDQPPGQNPGAFPPGQNPGAFPPGQNPGAFPPGQNPGAFPPGQNPGVQPPGIIPGGNNPKPAPPPPPKKDDPATKITNLLPNDTEHVFRPFFGKLMERGSAFRTLAFETPGGLQESEFVTKLGIAAADIDVLIQAKKFTFPPWSYTVVHSKSGIDAGAMKKALSLASQPEIQGQEYFKLGKPNPWLNELAWLSFGVPDSVRQASPRNPSETFVRFHDDKTVIFSDKAPMVALLEKDGKFKRLTQEVKPPPPVRKPVPGAIPGDPNAGFPADPNAGIPADPNAGAPPPGLINPGAAPVPPGAVPPQSFNPKTPKIEFVNFRNPDYVPRVVQGQTAGQARGLANTTWVGTETLDNYGRLEFRFSAGNRAVMVDTDGTTTGSYRQSGGQVILKFGITTYTGTISGNTIKGTARGSYVKGPIGVKASQKPWSFTVTKSAAGQVNPGQNPPPPPGIDPGQNPPMPPQPPGVFPPGQVPGGIPGMFPPGQHPGAVQFPAVKNTYLTINPTLKAMLDKMERLAEDEDDILFVAATEMDAARVASRNSDFGPVPRWQFRNLWDATLLMGEAKTNIRVMGSLGLQTETRKFHLRNEMIMGAVKSAKILSKNLREEGSPAVARFFELVMNHKVKLPEKEKPRPNPNQFPGLFPGGDPNDPNAIPPGLIPPGQDPGLIPPGQNPGLIPPGQNPGLVPPGVVPPGQNPGQFQPGQPFPNQPNGFPGAANDPGDGFEFVGQQGGGLTQPGFPNPGQPGVVPPGVAPPGAFPGGQPGEFPPGGQPGEFPPGGQPGEFPPGAFPPGQFPPGAFPPGQFPPGAFPPGQFPGMPGARPKPKPKVVKHSQINITQDQERVVFTIDLVFDNLAYKRFHGLAQSLMIGVKGEMDLADKGYRRHFLSQAAKQLGMKSDRFPSGAFPRPATSLAASGHPHHRVSWMASLLPFLGKDAIFKKIQFQESWKDPSNWMASQTLIPEFLDPTYPSDSRYVRHPSLPVEPAATHYVGIAGVGRNAANYPTGDPDLDKKRGVFGYERSLSLKEIQDGRGASNTVLLIQTPHDGPGGATPWIAGGGATLRGVPEKNSIAPFVLTTDANGNPITHNGKRGTFVLMVDGSVRFVSQDVSDEVFQAMCTVQGPVPPGFNLDNNEHISLIPRPKSGPVQAAK